MVQLSTIGPVVHDEASLLSEIIKRKVCEGVDFKTAQPIVDMLTAFKMVYDEARVSASKFYVREGGIKKEKTLNSYGLSNVHLPVLSGSTFKPERRTGLMHSLGPLTLALIN